VRQISGRYTACGVDTYFKDLSGLLKEFDLGQLDISPFKPKG